MDKWEEKTTTFTWVIGVMTKKEALPHRNFLTF